MKRLATVVVALVALVTVGVHAGETELKGKLGCGHCEFKKGKGCSAAFKAEDGKVYIIENPTKAVKDARVTGGQVKVTGTVSDKNGTLHVQASQQELIK